MTSNAAADLSYKPKPGDLAWKVLQFLNQNPEKELTAVDMGIKFDVAPDMVQSYLRFAVANEYLRKSTNHHNAHVWKLGAIPFKTDSSWVASTPAVSHVAPEHRLQARTSLPTIRKGTPLVDEATRKRKEIDDWLRAFEPGDSATFPTSELDEMRKQVARFRKDNDTHYFAFVQVSADEWGIERRAERPKWGRQKGAPAPVAKKKAAK